jgi:hypothetical protein
VNAGRERPARRPVDEQVVDKTPATRKRLGIGRHGKWREICEDGRAAGRMAPIRPVWPPRMAISRRVA